MESTSNKCAGPSRSRRRLDVHSPVKEKEKSKVDYGPIFNDRIGNGNNYQDPLPSTSTSVEMCPQRNVENSEMDTRKGICKPLERRLTRSASKRFLKIYESIVPGQHEDCEPSTSNAMMLPPPHPLVNTSRPSCSGMTTRLRHRTLRNSRGVQSDVNKISQNFYKRLSFDQVSNTSDYGTASENSRKCSVTSGGMSPVSDSGDSCHCASLSGIESLGTSSGGESPPHSTAMDWAEKPCADVISAFPNPRVTIHTVEGVSAFIPDVNRSGYMGAFSVSIRGVGCESNIYRSQSHQAEDCLKSSGLRLVSSLASSETK